MKRWLIGCCIALCLVGCRGRKGETGAPGASARMVLKTYAGQIASDGTTTISVPEIRGKAGSVIVEAYWAFSTSPTIYTKMADGWLDNNTNLGRLCSMSWTYGTVYLEYMSAGDLYRIDVYTLTTTSQPAPLHRLTDIQDY